MTHILQIENRSYEVYTNKELGKGMFGSVFEGLDHQTGGRLAIKLIRLDVLEKNFPIKHEYEKMLQN
jgi:predicted Ser/Thr protein kinase